GGGWWCKFPCELVGTSHHGVDVVSSNFGRVAVELMGLLSDEREMFHDGTFCQLPLRTYRRIAEMLNGVDCVIPFMHQTLKANVNLSTAILELQSKCDATDAVPSNESCSSNTSTRSANSHVLIIEMGQDAERVAIADLLFDESSCMLLHVNV
ncbi:hypothetical protein HJC23_013930, partial [Cyclotella cryptica]